MNDQPPADESRTRSRPLTRRRALSLTLGGLAGLVVPAAFGKAGDALDATTGHTSGLPGGPAIDPAPPSMAGAGPPVPAPAIEQAVGLALMADPGLRQLIGDFCAWPGGWRGEEAPGMAPIFLWVGVFDGPEFGLSADVSSVSITAHTPSLPTAANLARGIDAAMARPPMFMVGGKLIVLEHPRPCGQHRHFDGTTHRYAKSWGYRVVGPA